MRLATPLVVLALLAACAPSELHVAAPAEPTAPERRGDAAEASEGPVAAMPEPVEDRATASLAQAGGAATASLARAGEAGPSSLPSLSVPGVAVPLRVELARVSVTIDGRLARTEVTTVFRSALVRAVVGTYEVALPPGAVLARLAMDVDGAMREGEVMDTEVARGLRNGVARVPSVESAGRFQAAVFPVPAGGTKTVVIAYDELLPVDGGQVVYRFALPRVAAGGAASPGSAAADAEPLASDFAFELSADPGAGRLAVGAGSGLSVAEGAPGGRLRASLAARDFRPSGSLAVGLAPSGGLATRALVATPSGTSGGRGPSVPFFVDWTPPARAPAGDLVVALDTSWSIGPDELERASALVAALVADRAPRGRVTVVHGDLRAEACPEGPIARCLAGLDAGGGSDLAALLDAAFAQVPVASPSTVVLVGDGLPSLGERDPERLASEVGRALESHPKARLHAVAVGASPNLPLLSRLAAQGGGAVVELRPERPVVEAARELAGWIAHPLVRDVTASVLAGEGVELAAPLSRTVALGGALPLYGRYEGGPLTLALQGELMGEAVREVVAIDAASTPSSALVHDTWARAMIAERARAGATRREVVALSREHGVVSGATAVFVAANERRLGARAGGVPVAKEASAVVGDATAAVAGGGGEDAARAARLAIAMAPREPDFIGMGGGWSGFDGENGGDTGVGRIMGMGDVDGGRPPSYRTGRVALAGPLEVRGCALDRIAAVVTRRARELGDCFRGELARRPDAVGRLTVRWVVDSDGAVAGSHAVGDRSPASDIVACARGMLRNWRFARSEGGVCAAEQTFELTPGSVHLGDPELRRVRGQPFAELIASAGGDVGRTVEALAVDDLATDTRWAVLAELVMRGQEDAAVRLVDRWTATGDARRLGSVAEALARTASPALVEVERRLLARLLDSHTAAPTAIERYATLVGSAASLDPDEGDAVVVRLVGACPSGGGSSGACVRALRPFAARPEVATRVQAQTAVRVAEIERARRAAAAEGSWSAARRAADLTMELASLVAPERRDRVSSELAELGFEDRAGRRELSEARAPGGDRDRTRPDEAVALAENLAQARGRDLPSLAVVLTVDGGDARLALRVRPVGNAASRRVGRSDSDASGLGPQVFLFDRGAPGTYEVGVISYGGVATQATGVLTIIRAPGTAAARREDIPLRLDVTGEPVAVVLTKVVIPR